MSSLIVSSGVLVAISAPLADGSMYATTYEWATSGPSDEYTISDTSTVSSEGAITQSTGRTSKRPAEASRIIMVNSVARLGIEPVLVCNPKARAHVPLSTERRMSAKKTLNRVS